MKDNVLTIVYSSTTTKQAWDLLVQHCEISDYTELGQLLRQFWSYDMPEDMEADQWIREMREIYDSIRRVSQNFIGDKEWILCLAYALPASWTNIKATIQQQKVKGMEAQGANIPQLATETTAMVMVEGQRLRVQKTKEAGGSSMGLMGRNATEGRSHTSNNWRTGNTQNLGRGPSQATPDRSNKECFHCKKKGHFTQDCFKNPQSKKYKGKKKKENAALAKEDDMVFMALMDWDKDKPWILDSGAESHVVVVSVNDESFQLT